MTRKQFIDNFIYIYDIINIICEKNECAVIHVRHKKLERDMIVHSLPKYSRAYEFLKMIKFENLPEVYDTVELEDGMIVFEEYIDGLTVAEIMESGKYSYEEAAKVLGDVCAALSILHENGIVHRDIKPENIMVDEFGRVVLIDFNASRMVTKAKRDTEIMGTVGYASPEQLGVAQSDERTDIYAMGILLNVMITGKHPSEKLAKGKAGRIVRKCTQLNPDDRYQTAMKLAAAL